MTPRIAAPRLLPVTIFALAGLLAVKSIDLVRAAVPANAAEHAPAATVAAPAASPAAHPGNAKAPVTPAAGLQATPAPAKAVGSTPAAPAPATPAAAEPAPVSDSERTLLLELRQRRQELDTREQTLAAREAVLAAAERKLSARVDELQALQTRLEGIESARKSHEEANWRGLVKLYESMKPRDAALIFNELDMQVLLQVVDRMKEAKAAAVMAAMQPEKARQVTTELARMRTRASSDSSAGAGG
jgi:flagellar motility protein MotE (MotC chaperone)